MPVGDTRLKYTPVRCPPIGDTCLRCLHARCLPARCTHCEMHAWEIFRRGSCRNIPSGWVLYFWFSEIFDVTLTVPISRCKYNAEWSDDIHPLPADATERYHRRRRWCCVFTQFGYNCAIIVTVQSFKYNDISIQSVLLPLACSRVETFPML